MNKNILNKAVGEMLDEIGTWDDNYVISLWNFLTIEANDGENQILENDLDEIAEMLGDTPSEFFYRCYYGDYKPDCEWVFVNGYENIETVWSWETFRYKDYLEELLKQYIEDNEDISEFEELQDILDKYLEEEDEEEETAEG